VNRLAAQFAAQQ
jgi:hypothetical protein